MGGGVPLSHERGRFSLFEQAIPYIGDMQVAEYALCGRIALNLVDNMLMVESQAYKDTTVSVRFCKKHSMRGRILLGFVLQSEILILRFFHNSLVLHNLPFQV